MMDKRKLDGAVDKCSASYLFINAMRIVKIWSPTPSGNGSYSRQVGWLAKFGGSLKILKLVVD